MITRLTKGHFSALAGSNSILESENTTSQLGGFGVGLLHGRDDLFEFGMVFLAGLSEADGSAVLLANQVAETGLTLDNAVRNVHLAAKGGKPHNQFDGVNIVRDDNQLGLALFDKSGNMVDTELDHLGLVARLGVTSLSFEIGLGHETLLLVFLGFRAVMRHDAEQVGGL